MENEGNTVDLETFAGQDEVEILKKKLAEMEAALKTAKGLYSWKPEVITEPKEIPVYVTSAGGNRFPKKDMHQQDVTEPNPKYGRLGVRLRNAVVPTLFWLSEVEDLLKPENLAKIRDQVVQYHDLMAEAEKAYLNRKGSTK